MQLDEALITQVEMKATGANIHTVRNVIGVYKGCYDLISLFKENAPPEVLVSFINTEKKLRQFVNTGIIKLRS